MSEVSDLAFVVDDGVLSDPWVIQRSTGTFQLGGWKTTSVSLDGWGVVSVASDEDLRMLPEGDEVTGAMVFHSQSRIYETQLDQNEGQGFGPQTQRVSDKMLWNFHLYRVLKVFPYPNRNYWKAIAVRIQGN